MIVADARAVLDVLLAQPNAPGIRQAIREGGSLHVPEHFHIEVLSGLRRFSLRGDVDDQTADRLIVRLAGLRVVRYPILALRAEIWRLRHHRLTGYDAAYLALARFLDCPLVTLVAGLAAAAREDRRLVTSYEPDESGLQPASLDERPAGGARV